MKVYTSSFVGIPLPEQFLSQFQQLLLDLRTLLPNLATVYPNTAHITLYYLSTQPISTLEKVAQIIDQYKQQVNNTKLLINRLGVFVPKRPRVLFLAVTCPNLLAIFHKQLRIDLATFHGVDNEIFTPHLTIGRINTKSAKEQFFANQERLNEKLATIQWEFPITELGIFGIDLTNPERHQEQVLTIKM